jgi:LPS-assembly protein
MKNKLIIIKICIYFFLIIFVNKIQADELEFNSSTIQSYENGNIIKAYDGVRIKDPRGIIIDGDQFIYDKKKSILTVEGNILVNDKINKNILRTEKIIYFQLQDKINTINSTTIEINKKHTLETSNITYNIDQKEFFTKEKAIIKDKYNNVLNTNGFNFSMIKNILKAKNVKVIDKESNRYNIENFRLNLNTNKILGKDFDINFNNRIFNSKENEPRLKGKALFLEDNTTIIKKGVFTTCKKRDGCPPWELSAEEIAHDKIKKTLNYKNAWLKVYNVPVLYFPKFFHPDPTVKRQSGFLTPQISQSSALGSYVGVPYFKTIADNIDFTFKPRFYNDQKTIYQTEYRHVTKNTNNILDFSIKNKNSLILKNNSQSHFFSESSFNLDSDFFDQSKIDLKIQQTSNETYLKTYKLNSPLITSSSSLHSKISFNARNNDSEINFLTEVYEDLSKKDNDRYEYVYPSYDYSKNFDNFFPSGSLTFLSTGHNKLFDTNISEKVIINDFNYKSNDSISSIGLVSNYEILVKNFNADSKNSKNYKNKKENDIQSLINYQVKYPLKKVGNKYTGILSPIFSARYSPNQNKNIKSIDRITEYNNIFTLNRIGSNDTVEGGQSITLGNEFAIYDKSNPSDEIFSFNIATMFRDTENYKLPTSSTLGQKSSDIVGKMKFKQNEFIDFSYKFSLDDNLQNLNYNQIDTTFSVNNFVTTFEFLEKNNVIGNESYISNHTTLKFDNNNSLQFKTRENKEKDLTEYYNLLYEYENDCLVAGIEYKKDYYTDGALKPEEQLFFSITIMPFGKINSPNTK